MFEKLGFSIPSLGGNVGIPRDELPHVCFPVIFSRVLARDADAALGTRGDYIPLCMFYRRSMDVLLRRAYLGSSIWVSAASMRLLDLISTIPRQNAIKD